jgi:1-deoxy-D-xylulose-5-phosphate reductoisomerase
MPPVCRNVAVLGSTGSIGKSTLEVIAAHPQRLAVYGLSTHQKVEEVASQAKHFGPRELVLSGWQSSQLGDCKDFPSTCRVSAGPDALERLASCDEVDIVVAAIVGAAGLRSSLAAVEAGKTLALANKETLVAAGPIVMQAAKERKSLLLPVDSEHSAIFQCLQSGKSSEVKRVILTASGGPFRLFSAEQIKSATIAQALAHPTWNMGRKITIDSATMMNKALEIIEARWLFGLEASRISVVVHPQSIIHSMVEFCDGSVVAQMSPPDMKLPIQYALLYPDRSPCPSQPWDLAKNWNLELSPPDLERFPAILLGFEAAERGGTTGAVLNAANEAAVAQFLEGRLHFTGIVAACRAVLDHHEYDPRPTLDQILKLDQWAREEVLKWLAGQ